MLMTLCNCDCVADAKHGWTVQTQLQSLGMLYVGFWPHEGRKCYAASYSSLVQTPVLSSVGIVLGGF